MKHSFHNPLFYAFSLFFLGIAEVNIEPYDEDQGTGELRYVQVMDWKYRFHYFQFQVSFTELAYSI